MYARVWFAVTTAVCSCEVVVHVSSGVRGGLESPVSEVAYRCRSRRIGNVPCGGVGGRAEWSGV